MKYKILIMILILTLTPLVFSADAFLVTEIGTSADMISIGNIYSMNGSAESIFHNPAGLSRTKKYGISAFTTKFINECVYKNFAGTMRIGNGVLGAGYMELGIDDIPLTGESGNRFYEISKFDYNNSLTKIGYAMPVVSKNIYGGMSLSYLHSENYNVTGNGINGDLGMLFIFDPMCLSISLENLLWFSNMNYDNNAYEDIPVTLVTSAGYEFSDLRVLGQFKKIEKRSGLIKAFGLEYSPGFIKIVKISGGYAEYYNLNNINHKLTFGMGVKMFGVNIAYAFEKGEFIEDMNKHYYSINFEY
ncbi:MAG: hypothetical protein ABH857_04780 [Elusimicrobiota bacterium]